MQAFLSKLENPPAILQEAPPSTPSFTETGHVQAAKYVLTLSPSDFNGHFVDDDFRVWQCKTKREELSHFHTVRKLCKELVMQKGKLTTTYRHGNGSGGTGRVYVNDAGGIQRVSLPLRNMLTTPDMVDYDMANAHPTFLLWVCRQLDLPCNYLRQYVEERSKVLADTGKCKRDVLVMVNSDTNRKRGECPWIKHFVDELDTAKKAIHAVIKGGYPTDNKKNPLSSVVNKFLCDIEHRLLMSTIKKYATTPNPEAKIIPMYDGFMCNAAICIDDLNDHTRALGVTWKVKEWEQTPVPDFHEEETPSYEEVKAKFEEHFSLVKPSSSNGELLYVYKNQMVTKHSFETLAMEYSYYDDRGKEPKFKHILNRWLSDPNKRTYSSIVWEPYNPLEEDPTDVHTLNQAVPMQFEYIPADKRNPDATKSLDRILSHLSNTDEEAQYAKMFIAHLLQKPRENPQVGLIVKGHCGGVGKDTLQWTVVAIVGSGMVVNTDSMKQLFGDWNDVLDGKLLTCSNEAQGKDCMSYIEQIKNHLTAGTLNIRKKYMHTKHISNYNRFIGFSNNPNPFKIDRRFMYMQTRVDDVLPKEFFDEYYTTLKDPNFVNSMASDLMDLDISTFAIGRVPETDVKKNKQHDSIYPIHRFLQKIAQGKYDTHADVEVVPKTNRLAFPYKWMLSEYFDFVRSESGSSYLDKGKLKQDIAIWANEYAFSIKLKTVIRDSNDKQKRVVTMDREGLIKSLKNGKRFVEDDEWEYFESA